MEDSASEASAAGRQGDVAASEAETEGAAVSSLPAVPPAWVKEAQDKFVPPDGYKVFLPKKASSAIYAWGVRVAQADSTQSNPPGFWYCHASHLCIGAKRAIKITSNISAPTEHLKNKHGKCSSKTQMQLDNRAARAADDKVADNQYGMTPARFHGFNFIRVLVEKLLPFALAGATSFGFFTRQMNKDFPKDLNNKKLKVRSYLHLRLLPWS
jgi:hypothetical protein